MDLFVCKGCGFEVASWGGTCEKCGGHSAVSLRPNPVDANLGRVVAGRYRLTRKLGEGGMGSVYAAEQVDVGNPLAVKFLRSELSRDVELSRRFLHEARTYIRVAHPGAVQLHDFGRDEATGDLFISMELVEGIDLRRLLDEEHRLPLEAAVEISLQLADVLAHAHAMGVVHRDLKPENVMVRRGLSGFRVKLLDYGVARLVYEGATRMTLVGALAGTPRYMSPEQARGEDVDGRTDIYALGLLFYEMLSGVPGIESGALPVMLAQQVERALPPLGEVNAELKALPDSVDSFIAGATAKVREQRFGSMSELATELGALVGRAPMSLPAPAPPVPGGEIAKTLTPPKQNRVTDFPREPPPPSPRGNRRGLGVMALLLMTALFAAALLSARPAAQVFPVASGCPGIDLYDPKVRDLPLSELEERVRTLPYLMPSAAKNQLRTLQASLQAYAPEKRDCMYRMMLIGSVATIPTVFASSPALFGHTAPSVKLRSWFLELPLRQSWSPEQRASVLEQIDTIFLPHLKVEEPGDEEFWRQQYYGIELTCEASDATLEHLKARRTTDCLNLEPKL